MASFFSANKNRAGIIITLMVLIFLGASYFFVYLPNNEKILQERRFRCLQNIDNNIKSQIGYNIQLLNNLLATCPDEANFNKYVAANPQNLFKLFYTTERQNGVKGQNIGGDTSTRVKISVDPNTQQTTIFATRVSKDGYSTTTGMRFGFDNFVKMLLPADVFDHYIIFVNNKKLYETFASGLSYEKKDSLLQIKNGLTSPGLRSLTIGGTEYKVFLQPISVNIDSEWIIAGLVTNNNYQQERNQLPLWIVLLLLTVAITMIVSLPWIKLYHMGNKDKLTVRDGISSLLVSMVLMSLLFFVFFKYSFSFNNQRFTYLKSHYSRDSYSRNVLATKIKNAFEGELAAASKLLDNCDSLDVKDGDNVLDLGRKKRSYDTLLMRGPQHIAVQQVYWLDSLGFEINNWTTTISIVPHSLFNGRAYFINTIQNKPNKTGKHPFYLDQVVSRTTGVFTSVIAEKARKGNGSVAAMAFTAKSLDSVVMPDGYQFAIIDDKGKVLYHYLPDRNLTENLKSEFADSSQLVSCIEAKSDTSFSAEYFGRQYNIKIKAFSDLPYYVVVFEDLEYNNIRDTEAYVFTLSMLIFLLIFLIIQFGVVFFVSSKRSFFKKQLFETSWIGPRTTSHQQYTLAIVANIIIIIMLILFFDLDSFLKYVYVLLFSITFISIFLNSAFAKRYGNNKYLLRFKQLAIVSLCGFVLVIDIFAKFTLEPDNFKSLVIYESLLTVICAILFIWGPYLLVKITDSKKASFWTYTHSFALMTTTRLIITSGIPVAFFFIYSFNYEQNLDARYKHLHFANELIKKIRPTDLTSAKLNAIKQGSAYTSGVYFDDLVIDKITDTACEKHPVEYYHREDSLTTLILSMFRFHWNSVALKSNNLNFPSVDTAVFFNDLTKEKGGDKNAATTRTCFKLGNNKYIRLTSRNISYPYPKIYFMGLLVAIIVFYLVIHNIILKLFALHLPFTGTWKKMDEKLVLDNSLNRLLFILGSPGSGKLEDLKGKIKGGVMYGNNNELLTIDHIDPSMNNVFIADMIMISEVNGEDDPDWKRHKKEALKGHAMVILNHFEYNIKDIKTNSIKLDLLELLMQKGKSKIVIISTVHPVSFLDSFNQDQSNPMPENELERWHVLLGHFRIVIKPLESYAVDHTDTLRKIVMEETQYTHFLNRMQPMTLENLPEEETVSEIGTISDSLAFKLQLTSQYFYTYIWQSLTREEKFLLYDLAEDGLVNPYDDHNLSILICKGLVIKSTGNLMIFNKGFRNFILTSIGATEAKRIKDQVKDNGSWGNLRTPFYLAIMAILLFLFASQQEAYSRLITYIGVLGTVVPAILKIFSMFGNSTQKTS